MQSLLMVLSVFLVAACGGTAALDDDEPTTPDPKSSAEARWKQQGKPLGKKAALLAPRRARETAPETFRALLRTTQGEIEIECVRAWSPLGVDRFYNLVGMGFFSRAPFYSVVEKRYALFGLPLDPISGVAWRNAAIADEPAIESNLRGMLAFGRPGDQPNSRSTEILVNLGDNPAFDPITAPIGRVIRGLEVADALFRATDLNMQTLRSEGESYLANFPELDRIEEAVLVESAVR